MKAGLVWARDGRHWPNREFSRFLRAGGIDWHVQVMGRGPVLLLLHGTAASTHSFRALAPRLASEFTVVAPDLPGHAFTGQPTSGRLTLPVMSELVAALNDALGLSPEMAVGHSAGAAVLVRMALDGRLRPKRVVALNGALLPFAGATGHVAPSLAKLLFLNPLAPRLFSALAGQDTVKRLIRNMGSRIDREGIALYTRLMGNSAHVEGALGMMAHWDLETLARDLPRLPVPLTMVVASGDKAVPPATATQITQSLPGVEIRRLQGLGHLAHEENPDLVADLLLEMARRDGVL